MTPRSTFQIGALALVFGISSALADEEAKSPRIGEDAAGETAEEKKTEVSVDAVKIRRTTVYDEEEIKRLYKDFKAHNEKMNEALPAHLNSEEMELVTLKPLNVEGLNLNEQRELMERIEPRPRRRLQRIADIDPDAAHEMLVTMRNDAAFMSGEYDRRISAGDPGRTADLTAAQMVGALDKAFEAIGKALVKKKKKAAEDVK
jgi:hypothetical protein